MQQMFITFLYILELIIFTLFIVLSVASMIKGAVFLPTSRKRVQQMVDYAQITPHMLTADLGSGDGRLVIAMAKRGAKAHGFEINPFLVLWSRHKIKKYKLEHTAFIHWRSFWMEKLTRYNVVTVYGISYIMKDLEKKLLSELPKNAKVISNGFQFPTWKPSVQNKGIFVYQKMF